MSKGASAAAAKKSNPDGWVSFRHKPHWTRVKRPHEIDGFNWKDIKLNFKNSSPEHVFFRFLFLRAPPKWIVIYFWDLPVAAIQAGENVFLNTC